MIDPPYSQYPRAKLERLVQEGFEDLERRIVQRVEWSSMFSPDYGTNPMGDIAFASLMCADYYLRNTK